MTKQTESKVKKKEKKNDKRGLGKRKKERWKE